MSRPSSIDGESPITILASSEREGYAFIQQGDDPQLLYVDATSEQPLPVTQGVFWRTIESDLRTIRMDQPPLSYLSLASLREHLTLARRNAWVDEAIEDIGRTPSLFSASTLDLVLKSVEERLSIEAGLRPYETTRILTNILDRQGTQGLAAILDREGLGSAPVLLQRILEGLSNIVSTYDGKKDLAFLASMLLSRSKLLSRCQISASNLLFLLAGQQQLRQYQVAELCYALAIELLRAAVDANEVAVSGALQSLLVLWNTDLSLVPETTRWQLLRPINGCAKLLERSWETSRDAEELRNISIGVIRAYLLATRIRAAGKHFELRSRLSNLVQAVIAADRAKFFDSAARYIENSLVIEMRGTAKEIPKDPLKFLNSLEEESESFFTPASRLGALLNAADILRFQATAFWNFDRDADAAQHGVEIAEAYYAEALCTVPGVPRRKVLLIHRWARKLVLEADIFSGSNTYQALNACNRAIALLETLTPEDYKSVGHVVAEERGPNASAILKAEVLVRKARILPSDSNLRDQVEELLRRVILSRPEDAKPRQLLLEYYRDVERNTEAAVRHIDEWITDWRSVAKVARGSLEYLQYLAAQIYAEGDEERSPFFAVERYAAVLRDQTSNAKATSELIELLDGLPSDRLVEALRIVDRTLKPLSSRECPLTHAVIRVLFGVARERDRPDPSSPAAALRALIDGQEDQMAQATSILERLALQKRGFRLLLENISKRYLARGQSNFAGPDLEIADRILGVALASNLNDVVWMSRRIEIALLRGRIERARILLGEARSLFPDDPILALQTARLQIAEDRPTDARFTLRSAADETLRRGSGRIHPALVDRLAFLAMREGEFDEATKLYQTLLDLNPYDGRAHFGLGRVYFERGFQHWPHAFDEWLLASRIHTQSDEQHDQVLGWRTLRAIASLFDHEARLPGERDETAVVEQLMSRFERALRDENTLLRTMLLRAFSAIGIVDSRLSRILLAARSTGSDFRFIRSVAQFLMTQTVYGMLGGAADPADLSTIIEWSRQRKILAEYLGGAKGSYSRGLLRLRSRGQSVDQVLSTLSASYNPSDAEANSWQRVFEHVSTLGYTTDYYRKTYALVEELPYVPTARIADFTSALVGTIARKVWAEMRSTDAILESLRPAVSLWPISRFVHTKESKRPWISGWVDRDALALEEQVFAANGWRVSEEELVREIDRMPSEREALAFGQCGLYFRNLVKPDDAVRSFCYLRVLVEDAVPEGPERDRIAPVL